MENENINNGVGFVFENETVGNEINQNDVGEVLFEFEIETSQAESCCSANSINKENSIKIADESNLILNECSTPQSNERCRIKAN